MPQLHADLLRHTRRHAHGCHPPWLRAPDAARCRVAGLMQVLGYLRHSASSSLSGP